MAALKGYQLGQNLTIGASSTLTETIDSFEKVIASENYFEYLEKIVDHLKIVAHIPVRNVRKASIHESKDEILIFFYKVNGLWFLDSNDRRQFDDQTST